MRLLITTRALPRHGPGGMEAVAWDLAGGLRDLGAEVTVMTAAHPSLPPDGELEGVRVTTVDAPSRRYSRAWWRGTVERYGRGLARETDAVLSVSAAAHALAALPRNPGRPAFVFQAHGVSAGEIASKLRSGSARGWAGAARNLYWGLCRDRAYRRYDAVAAVGAAVEAQLRRAPTRWAVGPTPVRRIANGVDPAAFRFDAAARDRLRARLGIGDAARLVLYVGRLHVEKGLQLAPPALARAVQAGADLHLAVVGDGPARAMLEAGVAARRLQDRVHLSGPLARRDIVPWLSAADALLLPSLRVEGLPLTLLEALAAGLPVIASAQAAEPALPATRIDSRDGAALARTLAELGLRPGPRPSLLPPGYTLEGSARRYLQLFERLCSGRPA